MSSKPKTTYIVLPYTRDATPIAAFTPSVQPHTHTADHVDSQTISESIQIFPQPRDRVRTVLDIRTETSTLVRVRTSVVPAVQGQR